MPIKSSSISLLAVNLGVWNPHQRRRCRRSGTECHLDGIDLLFFAPLLFPLSACIYPERKVLMASKPQHGAGCYRLPGFCSHLLFCGATFPSSLADPWPPRLHPFPGLKVHRFPGLKVHRFPGLKVYRFIFLRNTGERKRFSRRSKTRARDSFY